MCENNTLKYGASDIIQQSLLTYSEGSINDNNISFYFDYKEIIRFEKNGDIYIKGKLVENDVEIVNGFREFLKMNGLYNQV